jgi:hypothetical protein
MLKETSREIGAKPASLSVPKPTWTAAFTRGVKLLVEERELALIACARANEPRSHLPAVRLLYVPMVPRAVH